MKVTIKFEDDCGNQFMIPTELVKEHVNTLHDLMYLFAYAGHAAGFSFEGLVAYDNGEDISNSESLAATFTPEDQW